MAEVGEAEIRKSVPVPERGTVWGLPEASSVIVIAPRRMSVVVGVKVTVIVQLAPAGRVAGDTGQVFV